MTRTELIERAVKAANDATKYNQLYYCTATVFYHENSDFIVLESYATIVAVYSKSANTVYEFDRYSNTTTQHVRKFVRFLKEESNYRFCPKLVLLYKYSRMAQKECKAHAVTDWADVIDL